MGEADRQTQTDKTEMYTNKYQSRGEVTQNAHMKESV